MESQELESKPFDMLENDHAGWPANQVRAFRTDERGRLLPCLRTGPSCHCRIAGRCWRRWAEGRGPSPECDVPRTPTPRPDEGGCTFIGISPEEVCKLNEAGAEAAAADAVRDALFIELYNQGTPWSEMADTTGLNEGVLRSIATRLLRSEDIVMKPRNKPSCLTPGIPCHYRIGTGCKRRWAFGRLPGPNCEIPILFPVTADTEGW